MKPVFGHEINRIIWIGLSGKRSAGKSTVSGLLRDKLKDRLNGVGWVRRYAYANLLYDICSMAGMKGKDVPMLRHYAKMMRDHNENVFLDAVDRRVNFERSNQVHYQVGIVIVEDLRYLQHLEHIEAKKNHLLVRLHVDPETQLTRMINLYGQDWIDTNHCGDDSSETELDDQHSRFSLELDTGVMSPEQITNRILETVYLHKLSRQS